MTASADGNPDLAGVRGYVLDRRGQFEAAARHLEEVLKTPKWLHSQFQKLYLAMACHHLGRGEQARTLLAEAGSWIATNPQVAPWFGARQELKMLREVAEELILGKPAGGRP